MNPLDMIMEYMINLYMLVIEYNAPLFSII